MVNLLVVAFLLVPCLANLGKEVTIKDFTVFCRQEDGKQFPMANMDVWVKKEKNPKPARGFFRGIGAWFKDTLGDGERELDRYRTDANGFIGGERTNTLFASDNREVTVNFRLECAAPYTAQCPGVKAICDRNPDKQEFNIPIDYDRNANFGLANGGGACSFIDSRNINCFASKDYLLSLSVPAKPDPCVADPDSCNIEKSEKRMKDLEAAALKSEGKTVTIKDFTVFCRQEDGKQFPMANMDVWVKKEKNQKSARGFFRGIGAWLKDTLGDGERELDRYRTDANGYIGGERTNTLFASDNREVTVNFRVQCAAPYIAKCPGLQEICVRNRGKQEFNIPIDYDHNAKFGLANGGGACSFFDSLNIKCFASKDYLLSLSDPTVSHPCETDPDGCNIETSEKRVKEFEAAALKSEGKIPAIDFLPSRGI